MKNGHTAFKWLSIVIFVGGFLIGQRLIAVAFVPPTYETWLMVAAMALVFYLSNFSAWLGLIFFGIGLAFDQHWITHNFGQFSIDGQWLMLGGFITAWFSLR